MAILITPGLPIMRNGAVAMKKQGYSRDGALKGGENTCLGIDVPDVEIMARFHTCTRAY